MTKLKKWISMSGIPALKEKTRQTNNNLLYVEPYADRAL